MVHDCEKRKDQSRKIQRRELRILEYADQDFLYQKDLYLPLGGKAQKLKR